MRIAAALVLVALLAGCDRETSSELDKETYNFQDAREMFPTSEAYLDPGDRKIAERGYGTKERPFPCARGKTEDGSEVIEMIPTDQCVRMTKTQRWTGLWRNDFEGSQLCLPPATRCDFDSEKNRIWLSAPGIKPDQALYRIEFIGRRTQDAASYGHMGFGVHEMIVDRMISMKQIEPPPTEAEINERWEQCVASGVCVTVEEMKKNAWKT